MARTWSSAFWPSNRSGWDGAGCAAPRQALSVVTVASRAKDCEDVRIGLAKRPGLKTRPYEDIVAIEPKNREPASAKATAKQAREPANPRTANPRLLPPLVA